MDIPEQNARTEVAFDPADSLRSSEAEELVAELESVGSAATTTTVDAHGVLTGAEIVVLVAVASQTAAGLAVIVA